LRTAACCGDPPGGDLKAVEMQNLDWVAGGSTHANMPPKTSFNVAEFAAVMAFDLTQ
jgi:hypothetical protein